MPNVKTIELTGGETAVTFEDSYPHYMVTNMGNSDIFASENPDIKPYADGVYTVPVGTETRISPEHSGNTVYLSGSGKAQIRAEETAEPTSHMSVAKGGDTSGGGHTTVDPELSDVSENPVRNKAISKALDGKADRSVVDAEFLDIKSYIGYSEDDVIGINADYESNLITDLKRGDRFTAAMHPGAKRCNISEDKTVTAYEGDANFADDGSNGEVVWYIPKFYSRFVVLEYKSDSEGGYDVKECNWYISSVRKGDFSTHSVFCDLEGNETDYILMNLKGEIFDFENGWWNDTEAKEIEFTYSRTNAYLAKKGFCPLEEISKGTWESFDSLPSPEDPDPKKRPVMGYTYYVHVPDTKVLTRYFWNGKRYVHWAGKE